jgi:carbon-monoxide dehydrogenase small subunit
MTQIELEVNGAAVRRSVEDRTLLVDFLRQDLGLTGTHLGCDTSQCGACTVMLNGAAVKSCTMLAVQTDGCAVRTVEGLAVDGALHPIQQAFIDCHGLQCGFCTSGMIMAIAEFLKTAPASLDDTAIHTALEGNICRCTGYVNIIAATRRAAHAMYPALALPARMERSS